MLLQKWENLSLIISNLNKMNTSNWLWLISKKVIMKWDAQHVGIMLKHLAHLCIERIVLEAKVTWYVTYCHMIYIAWRIYYPVLTGSLVFYYYYFFFNLIIQWLQRWRWNMKTFLLESSIGASWVIRLLTILFTCIIKKMSQVKMHEFAWP